MYEKHAILIKHFLIKETLKKCFSHKRHILHIFDKNLGILQAKHLNKTYN